ncbi:hypothetical protein RM649_35495 [Streptomyces sp. DSM 41770]|uniref:Uncharacterized protein n=1 Tax=Streptomyces salyersiae TaxID=3075530 RepID=A0ABU2RVR4_9ACTN|nr:hypothetical protein [Streptomyces sp. DSM 41770]
MKSIRVLLVAVVAVLAVSPGTPAQAAASACTHHFSGPQVCISTTGASGSANPGRVTASWTNPPRSLTRSTVRITEPGGFSYTLTARRHDGQIVASTVPGRMMRDGRLCARFAGSDRTACVQIIQRG